MEEKEEYLNGECDDELRKDGEVEWREGITKRGCR